MSNRVPDEIKEFVLKDLSKAKEFQFKLKKLKNEGKSTDPVSIIKAYQEINKKRDAERWDYAFDSYQLYGCFRNDRYVFDREDYFIYYTCSGPCKCYIKISADLLTSPKEIIECADALDEKKENEALQAALRKFCSVAYTAGNFCPVMKNKGGSKGTDTCWYKLNKYLDANKEYDGIEFAFCKKKGRGVINDLSNRDASNMFAMFEEELTGQEIIERLMLRDYFGKNYLELKAPQDYADTADEFIGFLNQITLPIIKRSIRIHMYSEELDYINNKDIDKWAKKLFKEL